MSMLAARIGSTLVLLCITTESIAMEVGDQLDAAREKYRSGDFSGALQQLDPLLRADDLDSTSKARARELAARALHLRGEEHFRQARIAESIADFDRELELAPDAHLSIGSAALPFTTQANSRKAISSSSSIKP